MTERLRALSRYLTAHAPWLVPALVATICFLTVARALYVQTFATFGRDQGIFQYVAWSLQNGERVYRDIHEINGPLPHLWHTVMQLAGGSDEHVFRSIDTVLLCLAYAFGAMTIPRWVGLDVRAAPKRAAVAWALAGIGVLGAEYTRYDWWHTAQREGLYSILVLTSLALQSIGHTTRSRRRAIVSFVLAGVTTSLTWFGKPPCVVFAALQVVVLVVDKGSLAISFRTAGLAFLAGATVVSAGMVGFVVAFGDVVLGVKILADVPRLHHTIWNESISWGYHAYGNAPRIDWAAAIFGGFIVAFIVFKLPRRALLAVVLPIGGFAVFAGQGKAFPYHMHMLTLGTAVGQLVLLASLARELERRPGNLSFVVTLAAIALGVLRVEDARLSPGMKAHWSTIGRTPELRASSTYFEQFPFGDFSARDLRDAAAYLQRRTRPDERVQTYGLDPYLLFLARRKTATPVIYNFELNVDAALLGGSGTKPSPELKLWLRAHRDVMEKFVLEAVEKNPPAAFALFDRAPFTHPDDSEVDLETHCPDLYRFLQERYVRAERFGLIRVWLRADVHARPVGAQTSSSSR